jgi:hypothetical protein
MLLGLKMMQSEVEMHALASNRAQVASMTTPMAIFPSRRPIQSTRGNAMQLVRKPGK